MNQVLLTAFAFSLLAISCEESFELESSIPTELVVESQLRSGAKPIVDLHAVNSLGDIVINDNLGSSYVTIKNSDGRTFELDYAYLHDSVATFTTSANEVIISGITYDLEISAPGYARVQSRTTVPNVAIVELPTKAEGITSSTINGNSTIVVPISIKDFSNELNFYHVLVWAYDRETISDIESSVKGSPANFEFSNLVSGSINLESRGWIFTDESFKNGTFSNELSLTISNISAMAKPTLSIEVRTVSQAYYSYFEQQLLNYTANIPKVGTVLTNDNIANGIGVFGSYAVEGSFIEISF